MSRRGHKIVDRDGVVGQQAYLERANHTALRFWL